MHTELPCFYSPVLNAAFTNDAFEECKTQTYNIEDVSASVFDLFAGWLYWQIVARVFIQDDPELDPTHGWWMRDSEMNKAEHPPIEVNQQLEADQKNARETRDKMIDLWILAERLIVPILQNEVIDALSRLSVRSGGIEKEKMLYVYRNTHPGSPLRRFFQDLEIRERTKEILKELEAPGSEDHFSEEFEEDFYGARKRYLEELDLLNTKFMDADTLSSYYVPIEE